MCPMSCTILSLCHHGGHCSVGSVLLLSDNLIVMYHQRTSASLPCCWPCSVIQPDGPSAAVSALDMLLFLSSGNILYRCPYKAQILEPAVVLGICRSRFCSSLLKSCCIKMSPFECPHQVTEQALVIIHIQPLVMNPSYGCMRMV